MRTPSANMPSSLETKIFIVLILAALCHCEPRNGVAIPRLRHCERSEANLCKLIGSFTYICLATLSPTRTCFGHCEERSDEAIHWGTVLIKQLNQVINNLFLRLLGLNTKQKFRRIIARGYKSKCGQHKELLITITESLTRS